MRAIIIIFIAFTLGFISMCYVCYLAGVNSAQKEIKERAKQIEKQCYTNTDIEYIIFKDSQL